MHNLLWLLDKFVFVQTENVKEQSSLKEKRFLFCFFKHQLTSVMNKYTEGLMNSFLRLFILRVWKCVKVTGNYDAICI